MFIKLSQSRKFKSIFGLQLLFMFVAHAYLDLRTVFHEQHLSFNPCIRRNCSANVLIDAIYIFTEVLGVLHHRESISERLN